MDNVQLGQMVTWLDEEHRRDRSEIAKLQQRAEGQEAALQEATRRIQELEGRLSSTQAQLTRFNQIEQSIEHIQHELFLAIERLEKDRLEFQREVEQARLADREVTGRGIAEVRKELNRFKPIEEDLGLRKAEIQRLGEAVMALRSQVAVIPQQIDERTRQIPFLVENRAQDNRRIGQLQQETVELFKRTESYAGRLDILEEGLRKLDKMIKATEDVGPRLERAQAQFMEQIRLSEADRNRRLQVWEEELEQHREIINRYQNRIQEFGAGYDEAKRIVKVVEELQSSLRREQAQVAELQRLAEERQRKEMENWQAEYEKRWKKEMLRFNHQWAEQEKFNQEVDGRFPPMREEMAKLRTLITHLWRLQEQFGSHHLAEAQRWLQMLNQALEEREEAERAGRNGRR